MKVVLERKLGSSGRAQPGRCVGTVIVNRADFAVGYGRQLAAQTAFQSGRLAPSIKFSRIIRRERGKVPPNIEFFVLVSI